MTKLKKMIALAIAMVMVICTMNFAVFAEPNPPAVDTTITITGLDAGDTVNLYQVLEWEDGEGWKVTADFASVATLDTIDKLVNPVKGQAVVQMTKDDLEEIAKVAKTKNPVNTGVVADGETSYTYTTFDDTATPPVDGPGMYIALVEPATVGVVYNPIIISADYEAKNSTNNIPASSAINGTAIAKKQPISGDKTENKITNDIGDTYNFKITTTIPAFADSFKDAYFTITDTLVDEEGNCYLELIGSSLKIMAGDTDITDTADHRTFVDGAQQFTLTWDDDYVKGLNAAQPIEITYSAKLTVTAAEAAALPNVIEGYNHIDIEFPNNPKTDEGKTVIIDETREYTFTIDGKLFGDSSYQNAELIKVGLDNDGNPVESMVKVGNGTEHSALDGATFGLYTDDACTKLYKNDVFEGEITTADGGLLYIPGLDVGTYYLKELTAPKGYIKDTNTHTIVITADIDGDEEGETGKAMYYTVATDGTVTKYENKEDAPQGSVVYTYYVPVLKSYTVTVDDAESTYEMTLQGPSISTVTPADSTSEIINTKGVELPATGGIGTTIFYVIGTVLVLGAGILLVTRRRMNME